MEQVTAEINFIKIVLGSFVKYNDSTQRENYLKSKLELIREEELKDQLFGYVGMSKGSWNRQRISWMIYYWNYKRKKISYRKKRTSRDRQLVSVVSLLFECFIVGLIVFQARKISVINNYKFSKRFKATFLKVTFVMMF